VQQCYRHEHQAASDVLCLLLWQLCHVQTRVQLVMLPAADLGGLASRVRRCCCMKCMITLIDYRST
jgi:hypothetical protein